MPTESSTQAEIGNVASRQSCKLPRRSPDCRAPAVCIQALRTDIADERGQQNKATDEDLQKVVDLHVVEPVVQHAKYEQADDGVTDTAAPAEQARAADHHRGDRVEQEISDAEHAGNLLSRANRTNLLDHGVDDPRLSLLDRQVGVRHNQLWSARVVGAGCDGLTYIFGV